MDICINGRFLTQTMTGVQRYASELVRALDSLIDSRELDVNQYTFSLLTPPATCHDLALKHIPSYQVGRLGGHLWEQLELPFYARGRPLLSLCNAAPLVKRNQVVTLHDAAVFAMPTSFSAPFRTWYQLLLPNLGRVARGVITISEFSERELERYCHIPASKLYVTYQGSEQILRHAADEAVLSKHGLTDRPFIFAVSSLNPSKNFAALAEAVTLMGACDFDVVVAGGANPKVFQGAGALPGNVKYLGYVSNGELRALYESAACYVFPSLYEGFGLTPLEAMTCGCPVIVSNAASLPEVCGDAALYCDPHSPQDIAAKIQRLMSDSELRERLRQKGLERARQFGWDKCARETLAVIRQTLGVFR